MSIHKEAWYVSSSLEEQYRRAMQGWTRSGDAESLSTLAKLAPRLGRKQEVEKLIFDLFTRMYAGSSWFVSHPSDSVAEVRAKVPDLRVAGEDQGVTIYWDLVPDVEATAALAQPMVRAKEVVYLYDHPHDFTGLLSPAIRDSPLPGPVSVYDIPNVLSESQEVRRSAEWYLAETLQTLPDDLSVIASNPRPTDTGVTLGVDVDIEIEGLGSGEAVLVPNQDLSYRNAPRNAWSLYGDDVRQWASNPLAETLLRLPDGVFYQLVGHIETEAAREIVREEDRSGVEFPLVRPVEPNYEYDEEYDD